MQFKHFLFETLLLAAVEAGPLRKDSQFQYRRHDGASQANSSTAPLVQSQTSSALLSEHLAASSVVPTADAPQVSAAPLFDSTSPTPSQDTTDSLQVIPVTQPTRPPTAHRASSAPLGSPSVAPSFLGSHTIQSSSSATAASSRTIVVSTAPVSQQSSTSPVSGQSSKTTVLLTASGIRLTSTLSHEASSTPIPEYSQAYSESSAASSSTRPVVSKLSKTAASVQTVGPAGAPFTTLQALLSWTTLSSKTTSPTSLTVLAASPSVATPNVNNIPTAIVNSAPPATGTVSPDVYAANIDQANGLNADFANLQSSSSCNDGQYACIDAEYAACTSAGVWAVSGCGAQEICTVMPLDTTRGVQIGCFSRSKIASVFGAVSGKGSTPGSSADSSTVKATSTRNSLSAPTQSSADTTSSKAGEGNGGAVTVTAPSFTAYLTVQPASSESTPSKTHIGNGGNVVTVTIAASTTTQGLTTAEDSAITTQSSSSESAEPAVSATTTRSTSTESTPANEQNWEGHPAATTATSASPLATLDLPTMIIGDPFHIIPVTRPSTTTTSTAASSAGVGFIGYEDGSSGGGGGTSTSTRVQGVTTSIFITVTAVEIVLVKETVTVGRVTVTAPGY